MTHLNMAQEKTRDLSRLEYLEVLVKEWFIADMRKKIYAKRSDKLYWAKVSKYKSDKIIDITQRNRMDNIFESNDEYLRYYNKFHPKGEVSLLIEDEKDIRFYYSRGADITVEEDNGQRYVGRIMDVDLDRCIIDYEVIDGGEERSVRFHEVRRIL